jgi:hypothetical protein
MWEDVGSNVVDDDLRLHVALLRYTHCCECVVLVTQGSQEVESCAVCLELYCNNDVIRILPCRWVVTQILRIKLLVSMCNVN